MEQMIPGFLEEMLKKQYGEEVFAKILAGYQARRPVTLRVNPLKADRNTVEQALTGAGIAFKNVSWYEDAMIIEGAREPEIQELPIYQKGGIYLQSLSSMLPPLFLDPKAGESVLDMAAAPGGKTTQMAAMTGNQAQITACEKNKARSEKLKYNLGIRMIRTLPLKSIRILRSSRVSAVRYFNSPIRIPVPAMV
jgi:tRNA (cytosine40_48-C5)-methyltransferase